MEKWGIFIQWLTKISTNVKKGSWFDGVKKLGLRIFICLSFSYFLAHSLNALLVPWLMAPIFAFSHSKTSETKATGSVKIERKNFKDLKKSVLDRNLFNIDGILPDEKDDAKLDVTPNTAAVTETGPCDLSKLALTLVGTLYMGGPEDSVAILQEKGQEESDFYRIGDDLLGQEDVSVANVFRNRVVLSNKGQMECLELAGAIDPLPEKGKGDKDKETKPKAPVVLNSAWVESQLGKGMSKIMSEVNLTPNITTDGRISGFRLFGISKGSLLDKIGLEDGDVVMKVNESVLSEQALVLYEAFQSDKSISIEVLRNDAPMSFFVQIQ